MLCLVDAPVWPAVFGGEMEGGWIWGRREVVGRDCGEGREGKLRLGWNI